MASPERTKAKQSAPSRQTHTQPNVLEIGASFGAIAYDPVHALVDKARTHERLSSLFRDRALALADEGDRVGYEYWMTESRLELAAADVIHSRLLKYGYAERQNPQQNNALPGGGGAGQMMFIDIRKTVAQNA